jgi:hypothetical protein
MSIRTIPVIFLLTMFLSGCGIPVPPERADYVGEWRSPQMRLSIAPDGQVEYERRDGGSSSKITGPIQAFKGNDFLVGIPFLSATFVVSKPPYKDGETWKMVVDGVELTKAQ